MERRKKFPLTPQIKISQKFHLFRYRLPSSDPAHECLARKRGQSDGRHQQEDFVFGDLSTFLISAAQGPRRGHATGLQAQ